MTNDNAPSVSHHTYDASAGNTGDGLSRSIPFETVSPSPPTVAIPRTPQRKRRPSGGGVEGGVEGEEKGSDAGGSDGGDEGGNEGEEGSSLETFQVGWMVPYELT